MSIFSDLKSIRSGVKKAKRDYQRILANTAEHHARHDADPEYRCREDQDKFYASLGHDIDPYGDTTEAAAYRRTANAFQEKHLKGKPEIQIEKVTIEAKEGDSIEDLLGKAFQVLEDRRAFEDIVSETKKKKGGK